jgi:Cytoskeletal-regulatory complex EF hand
VSHNTCLTASYMRDSTQHNVMLRDDHPGKLRGGGVAAPAPPQMRGLPVQPVPPAPGAPPQGAPYGAPGPAYGGVSAPQAAPPPPMPQATPQQSAWPPVTPDELQRYGAAFRRWDSDGDGRVTGAEAKPMFGQSGVSNTAWFKPIWDLADADLDGSLTLPEFVVASYFLERAARGQPPPPSVPPGIFPPPHALMAVAGQPGAMPPPQAPPPQAAPMPPPLQQAAAASSMMGMPPAPVAPVVSSNVPGVPALPEHLFAGAPASDISAARTAHQEATQAHDKLVAVETQRTQAMSTATDLTSAIRELTITKRRCEAQLSEAEYNAEQSQKQLAEAKQAHESMRAAAEAMQARLDAALSARQQAEAELAELQRQNPAGADAQAAMMAADQAMHAAQEALAHAREVSANLERAHAARMDAERQLAEARSMSAEKQQAMAQEEAQLHALTAELQALRQRGGGGDFGGASVADVARRCAVLAGDALAAARAQGAMVSLPPQLLAAMPAGGAVAQPAVFTEDWHEWEDFPDAGWTPIHQGAHQQSMAPVMPPATPAMPQYTAPAPPAYMSAPALAAPQQQYNAPPAYMPAVSQAAPAPMPYMQAVAPAVPPPLPPQRPSIEARPAQLVPPAQQPAAPLFASGLGSPGGAFGSAAPPPPPPPPKPLDDDFFSSLGPPMGGAPAAPPPPPPQRGPDMWDGF